MEVLNTIYIYDLYKYVQLSMYGGIIYNMYIYVLYKYVQLMEAIGQQ